MRILFVASRSAWPPIDGGRLLMAQTIAGLIARAHEVTFVAPAGGPVGGEPVGTPASDGLRVRIVPGRRPPRTLSFLLSLVQGQPWSVMSQATPPTRVEIARLLAADRFDVVHVEQLQALPKAEAAFHRRVPVVLRAENVESDLWQTFSGVKPFARPVAVFEARRLAAFEARALTRVTRTAALTEPDARRLRQLAPEAHVDVVPVPMPADLPLADRRLAGDPPLVLISSAWYPNREGIRWFVDTIWPVVRDALPGARLHLFTAAVVGAARGGIERHGALADSRDAFAPGAILAVPLRIASGARVRILEAWARGVPVVATRAAVAGLEVEDGVGVRLADTAAQFVQALQDLHRSPDVAARQVADGRRILAARHDPAVCAERLEAVYRRAIG